MSPPSTLYRTTRPDLALKVLRDLWIASLASVLPVDRIVIGSALGKIGGPRLALPYVHLQPLSLPRMLGSFTDERFAIAPIDYATFDVLSADIGREYKFRVNGYPVRYTAAGGDTVTTIRDALIATMNALGERTFGLPLSPSSFRLDPTGEPGSIYSIESPTDPSRMSLVLTRSTSGLTKYRIGPRRFTLRFDAYSENDKALSEGAHEITSIAYEALDTSHAITLFGDNRIVARPISPPLDLTALDPAGAGHEQRSSFDLLVDITSISVETAHQMTSVEITTNVSGQTNTFTVPD